MAKKLKNKRRSIFVDDALWAALKKAAKQTDRTPASIIRTAIRGWLEIPA